MLYTEEQVASLKRENFAHLRVEEEDHLLRIVLNRPEKKNALNAVMLHELAFALSYARHNNHVWVIVIEAEGDVFCSGADLHSLSNNQKESSESTIPEPEEEILVGDLFHRIYKPCIAKVDSDVFAGGILLLAGCTHVVACNDIKLQLPEVRRGLFPFQVMASLMELMPARKVLDWCIRAYPLKVELAMEWGLVTHVSIQENIDQDVEDLVQDILQYSPTAIRMGLEAYHRIQGGQSGARHRFLKDMLMKTMQTKDAEEGLKAFYEKRKPSWTGE